MSRLSEKRSYVQDSPEKGATTEPTQVGSVETDHGEQRLRRAVSFDEDERNELLHKVDIYSLETVNLREEVSRLRGMVLERDSDLLDAKERLNEANKTLLDMSQEIEILRMQVERRDTNNARPSTSSNQKSLAPDMDHDPIPYEEYQKTLTQIKEASQAQIQSMTVLIAENRKNMHSKITALEQEIAKSETEIRLLRNQLDTCTSPFNIELMADTIQEISESPRKKKMSYKSPGFQENSGLRADSNLSFSPSKEAIFQTFQAPKQFYAQPESLGGDIRLESATNSLKNTFQTFLKPDSFNNSPFRLSGIMVPNTEPSLGRSARTPSQVLGEFQISSQKGEDSIGNKVSPLSQPSPNLLITLSGPKGHITGVSGTKNMPRMSATEHVTEPIAEVKYNERMSPSKTALVNQVDRKLDFNPQAVDDKIQSPSSEVARRKVLVKADGTVITLDPNDPNSHLLAFAAVGQSQDTLRTAPGFAQPPKPLSVLGNPPAERPDDGSHPQSKLQFNLIQDDENKPQNSENERKSRTKSFKSQKSVPNLFKLTESGFFDDDSKIEKRLNSDRLSFGRFHTETENNLQKHENCNCNMCNSSHSKNRSRSVASIKEFLIYHDH